MAWLGRFDDFDYAADFGSGSTNKPGSGSRPGSIANTVSGNRKPPQNQSFSKHQYQAHRISSGSGHTTGNKASHNANACRSRSIGSYSAYPSNVSTEHCRIGEIKSEAEGLSVVGLIISKSGSRSIMSKKGNERYVLSFTIRDEPSAFINVSLWGGYEFTSSLAMDYNIGDVVEIKGAQVQAKSNTPSEERYKPWTPSSFQLNVGESHSVVTAYRGEDIHHYLSLLHIPTKSNNDFYTFEDIQSNGLNLQGEHVNILALVKKIWPVKNIVKKSGEEISKVDIVLCDETCLAFTITLWNNSTNLVENWIPLETVIFAADVRINYNEFRSTMVAVADSKTIFTIDPDTAEAASLRQFCKTQGAFSLSDNPEENFEVQDKDPEIESITNILTVRDASELQNEMAYPSSKSVEYGVIYALLSRFDIDTEDGSILKDVCSNCRKNVWASSEYVCVNPDCAGGDPLLSADVEYNLTIDLSDCTGTLKFCYVPPTVLEQLLDYKAKEFKNLAGLQRTYLKWEFLLERMKTVVKLKRITTEKDTKVSIRVLAFEKAKYYEIAQRLS